jgi:hypothetical protein
MTWRKFPRAGGRSLALTGCTYVDPSPGDPPERGTDSTRHRTSPRGPAARAVSAVDAASLTPCPQPKKGSFQMDSSARPNPNNLAACSDRLLTMLNAVCLLAPGGSSSGSIVSVLTTLWCCVYRKFPSKCNGFGSTRVRYFRARCPVASSISDSALVGSIGPAWADLCRGLAGGRAHRDSLFPADFRLSGASVVFGVPVRLDGLLQAYKRDRLC